MLIYIIIAKGIKVSGKVAIFSVLMPYVLFTILFVRIIFLEGSWSGIKYILIPKFEKLRDPTVWQNALGQSFFQNNIGYGTLLTFATFRKKDFPIQKSSLLLILANILSALMSSFVVFGYLGYFSQKSGISLEDLPLEGASLIFVTYPATLAMMPFTRFWMVLFFLTLIFLCIDSQLTNIELISYFFIDFRDRFNKQVEK